MIFYLAGHYLVYRLYASVFKMKRSRIMLLFVFYLFAFLYILIRLFDKYIPDSLQVALNFAGGLWFAVISYLFIFTVIYYLLYLLHVIHSKVFDSAADIQRLRIYYVVSSSVFVLMILACGIFNAVSPGVRHIELSTPKKLPSKLMKIAVVSDIHIGYLIGRGEMLSLREEINSFKPDLILVPGDIVDGELAYIKEKDSGRPLAGLRSLFGVFASMGNHDYFGGAQESVNYINGLGIRMLRDETVRVAENISIIGRNDTSVARRKGFSRAPLADIIKSGNVHPEDFIILLDHTPSNLDDAAENGVDLQLSGHTHNGQFWPYSIIVNMIFELPWGYLEKGGTSYYVSCGYGTWGPRIRIGSRSEIVLISLVQK